MSLAHILVIEINSRVLSNVLSFAEDCGQNISEGSLGLQAAHQSELLQTSRSGFSGQCTNRMASC